MSKRILSVIVAICMSLSLFGCTAQPQQTQAPTANPPVSEATLPPVDPADARDLYAQARDGVENALNLSLSVTASSKRSVGGEVYTESATQSISLQNPGKQTMQASVQDSTTMGEFVLTSQEFYSAGQVWMLFDNMAFTAKLESADYLARFAPAVLLDEALYADVALEAGAAGYTLRFSEPSAGESWLVPETAELVSASGTAAIDAQGNLTRSTYSVSYRYGSTLYTQEYTVSVTIPEALTLSNTLPVAREEYISLDYIDAPWLLSRANYDLMQAQVFSYTSTDTMITYAGGAIWSQQEALDVHGTGPETMSKYTLDLTLQGQAGILDEYAIEEHIQNKTLKYTENDGLPTSQTLTGSQITDLREAYVDLALDFLWTPQDLDGASFSDLGSVYLLELTGNAALGDIYEGAAASTFWQDSAFLRNLAEKYRTEKLTGYLSIDKYTGLPVAFGFDFEGVHTIEGQEYSLTDQWNQTFFLGSNTAYEAITGEPTPDIQPEQTPTPLFYHVTGENGQEMWLIGTIHVGDDRTGFLPQEIYDALLSSDALAVEFDMDAFDEALENDPVLLSQVQAAYFYADGSMTKDHLDEEIYEDAVKLLKATGGYHMNAEYIKPYLWTQTMDNFMLQQGYGLVSEKGVDNSLLRMARENEIPIRDIESGLFQIQMLTGFSQELQQLLLEESLYTDSAEYCASVEDLFEKWCAGDETVLREELSDEVDTSELTEEELAEYEEQKHLIEEYNKAMSYDRNDGMLQKAIEYLESGEVVFYAVGLAHLLNNVNGLVDTLRQAGYTVELVTYGG